MDQNVTVKGGRPRQRIPWSEKVANNKQWFKQCMDYYISISRFYGANSSTGAFKDGRNLKMLYDVYNNQFPAAWFTHFTNPLSASADQNRRLPAKIRPTTILRSNIDLLIGEYRNRPFTYMVVNMDEEGYNEYTEQLNQKVNKNLMDHFYQEFLQQMQSSGQPMQDVPSEQDIPYPEQVEKDFLESYKDKYAVKGQKWLDRSRREYEIDRTRVAGFKDYVIAGEVYTYKGFVNGEFTYRQVNPLDADYDKSPRNPFIEDGEWFVERELMTLADVVDEFWDDMRPSTYDRLEEKGPWYSPQAFYDYLYSTVNNNYIPVYRIQWKGVKKINFIVGTDEMGQPYEDKVDEDYVLQPGEKIVKSVWVSEVYEGTRIADLSNDPEDKGDKNGGYVKMGAIEIQRNPMNNFSICKLNYNGRKFSDRNSVNISVLEMGIPFQIMYIIVGFVLEKMLAKSKGQILLFDKNAIPKGNGWNEEKFFYYLEAMNIGLLARHQQGVDRSWNQYTTMNMSQISEISMLTQMQDHLVQQWDDTLGVNRQRKGQTYASDGQGVNERAVFQSSVITDMIFNGYEEFMEREMQGILDFGRFINANGLRALYNEDITTTSLLKIEPEDFVMSSLGVFSMRSNELEQVLNGLKQNVQAMIQNGMQPSTVIEIYNARNLTQLSAMLKQIEKTQAQQQQQASQQEQEHEVQLENMKKEFLTFQSDLKIREINAEWDRRDQNSDISAEAKARYTPLETEVADDVDDTETWAAIDREKIASQERINQQKLAYQERKDTADRSLQWTQGNRELDIKEQDAKTKRIAANKPKPSTSK